MALSKKRRFEVFKRDGFTCQYCGRKPPEVLLEADHITPQSKGGDDDSVNIITACRDCNRGKGARELTSIEPPIVEQVAERIERTAQVKQFNKFLMAERRRQDKEIGGIMAYWSEYAEPARPEGHELRRRATSFRVFLRHLPAVKIMEAIDIAFTRRAPDSPSDDYQTWKYFCGVCWSKIKEGQNE